MARINTLNLVALGWLALILGAGSTHAVAATNEINLVVTEENDLLSSPFGAHQDRHYTQGLKITLVAGDTMFTGATVAVDEFLPKLALHSTTGRLGLVLLGQNIYTPTDITAKVPDPNDRPYAGWLYMGLFFQRRGLMDGNWATLENWGVDLGIVGPDSIGDASQLTVHRWWFSNDLPEGWKYQLKDEPGLLLKYDRAVRLPIDGHQGRFADLIPHIGGNAGNIRVSGTVGLTGRLGWNLPDDFGVPINDSNSSPTPAPSATAPFGFHAFGRLDGSGVAHDLFLDGNTFRKSRSVTRNPWVADFVWGAVCDIGPYCELSYTHITRTTEFTTQKNNDIFGSLSIKFNFEF